MIQHSISDWDDAYANGPHIVGSEGWPDLWRSRAAAYRDGLAGENRARLDLRYGEKPRNGFDLFLPAGAPKGLVVFIHGGYWMKFDNSLWSHLARGAVESGWAVALPGYTLCPEIRIGGIVAEIGAAIATAAAMVAGPIRLAGHSAGGHLATRMITATSPLPREVRARIVKTVSISGVHDLRPLMRLSMNGTLRIDGAEADAESPALLQPMPGARLICWAGAAERSEFLRQNALLANVWTGLGASTACVEEPDRHHFNVVDGLTDPNHQLTRALLDG